MKKMIAILLVALCVVACVPGCGEKPDEQILEKIASATTVKEVLSQHDNFMRTIEYADGYTLYWYYADDTYLHTDEAHAFAVLCSPEESCEVGFWDDGRPYFDRYINVFNANLSTMFHEEVLIGEETGYEKVTSQSQKDGILYVNTQLAIADMSDDFVEGWEQNLGMTFIEGDVYCCEYEVDAETYILLQSYEYIKHADGTDDFIGRVTISLNVEEPAYIAELIAEGDKIDALPEDQVRIVNVVVDPGTESERTISQTVKLGDLILLPKELQGYGIFADPEGKKPWDGETAQNDRVTYYLIKTE